ncbi:hypothetical protein [Mycolicibacterium arseniciresistens]|uniref:Uncharacterized protein n=1 Tax=Mycolicibacterium arseniciresistens TaxID=3062257 RepID=A0ABT8UDV3_9MYCO|nr:hypothetical protein [Mycolicibacterium arseniciresistens]MDO3635035.1 hypothetical protein [Mycolicibacterium arseniciresistens]
MLVQVSSGIDADRDIVTLAKDREAVHAQNVTWVTRFGRNRRPKTGLCGNINGYRIGLVPPDPGDSWRAGSLTAVACTEADAAGIVLSHSVIGHVPLCFHA